MLLEGVWIARLMLLFYQGVLAAFVDKGRSFIIVSCWCLYSSFLRFFLALLFLVKIIQTIYT